MPQKNKLKKIGKIKKLKNNKIAIIRHYYFK